MRDGDMCAVLQESPLNAGFAESRAQEGVQSPQLAGRHPPDNVIPAVRLEMTAVDLVILS